MAPKEWLEPLIYTWLIRSTDDNQGLLLASEMDGDGGDPFYGTEPLICGISGISR